MLAQNFKTPTDLDISDAEFDALRKVLGMLERGEIAERQFDMRHIHHDCGSPARICGWALHVSNNYRLFGSVWPQRLADLLRTRTGVNTSQAAIALRNYLTHGEPRWNEALAS